MAVMALNRLRQRGISVPLDMSVTDYGGWSYALSLAEPNLTTVTTPLRQSGALAQSD